MSGSSWRWARVLTGVAVLAAVVAWTGTGPFEHGLRSLDLATLALGAAIAVPTTVACAWRWHLVAEGLGVGVDLRRAVAACYRAQFLNATLPGGVLGDVHRGMRHGTAVGAVGRGLRSVAWERAAGQAVQAALVLVALVLLPSPFRAWVPWLVVAGVVAVAVLVRPGLRAPSSTRGGRLLGAVRDDVRHGLLPGHVWPGIVLASAVAVAGHLATYLVVARAVGVTAPVLTLVPLVLLVLLAAGLPLNVAGWGPREGMAAWAFAAAGLGAGQGVATAAAYGAVVVVASLPGAVVLLVSLQRPPRVVEGVVSHG